LANVANVVIHVPSARSIHETRTCEGQGFY